MIPAKPAALAAVLILLTLRAWPQTGAGSIQGTVRDPSGAVIPAAKVTLVHAPTGWNLDSVTNSVGFFLFPSVPVGRYTLEVEVPGMELWKAELTLQAGQVAEVNPEVRLLSTTTQVTVAGDVTPLVTTTSPTLGAVLERARIEQLPLNTRWANLLPLLTTPGMEGTRYLYAWGLKYGTQFLMDGSLLENRDSGFNAWRPPGIDTVEELRVETNNSSAKFSSPGTVITTTKSGTNELHGAAFETAYNNAIGKARNRQDYYAKPPHLVRNEFGISMGGPIVLPRLYNGRNRTFFFFAYEGYRYMTKYTGSVTMPTMAMREGDFSGLVDAQGRLYALYDPWSTDAKTWQRIPFPNNRIPKLRESPLSKYLYEITPPPTHPDINPLVQPNWIGLHFRNQRQFTVTTRIDHQLSSRDRIFFRHSYLPNDDYRTSSLGGGPATLDLKANARTWESFNHSAVVSWTHTFSPTFFAETLLTAAHDYWGTLPLSRRENVATALRLPNPFNAFGFPRITQTGFGMDYYAGASPALYYAKVFTADQNFTKVYGRHQLEFGLRLRYDLLDTLTGQGDKIVSSQFASFATALYDPKSGTAYAATPFTGHNAANLYIGVASLYSVALTRNWYNMSVSQRAGYLQDTFRAAPRLTLSYGVRYEYNAPPVEKNNAMVGFDLPNKALVLGRSVEELAKLGHTVPSIVDAYSKLGVKFRTIKETALPERFIHRNLWDFGPRAGFAYQLGSLTKKPLVIRGGYSIYSFLEPLKFFNSTMASNAPLRAEFTRSFVDAAQSPDGLPNYSLRSVPAVIAGVNSADVIDLGQPRNITRGSARVLFFNPRQPTARAHQWHVTIEREILPETSFKAGYAGTHGTRRGQIQRLNEASNSYVWYVTTGLPLPTGEYAAVARRPLENTVLGSIDEYLKSGWSNCSGLYAEVQRRYAKGLAFQVYFTNSIASRAGGEGSLDDAILGVGQFLPGAVPTDLAARNRLLNYHRDVDIPQHRLNANWLLDLPFGRGKLLGRNAGGLMDRLIGGWQIAGTLQLLSQWFALPTVNWRIGEIRVYKKKYPIKDCRSGVCFDGYLWYNGYIPAHRINSYDASGKPNGVMGVPPDYTPSHSPLIPTPKDGGSRTDPLYPYYESNTVWVPMKDGSLQRVAYDNNLHPWRNQYMLGPKYFLMNASAFKTIQITERFRLRFNADFFNVLNYAGLRTPDPVSGIVSKQYNGVAARSLQLTLRLSW